MTTTYREGEKMRSRKPIYNAVIETATGELLRAGYCDFEDDGSFDGRRETQVEVDRDDLERRGKIRDRSFERLADHLRGELVF
jgi:hypothetical protein